MSLKDELNGFGNAYFFKPQSRALVIDRTDYHDILRHISSTYVARVGGTCSLMDEMDIEDLS